MKLVLPQAVVERPGLPPGGKVKIPHSPILRAAQGSPLPPPRV
jgi:hypothetical protein